MKFNLAWIAELNYATSDKDCQETIQSVFMYKFPILFQYDRIPDFTWFIV